MQAERDVDPTDATSGRREESIDPPPCRSAVLVVEDNDLVREMCEIVLRESGREIRASTSAAEARDALETDDAVGVVVTDLTMPGEWSGPDLIRHLIATRPHIGIVVTTGMVDPDLSFAPTVELVHKPFTVDQLLRAVERAAGASGGLSAR